MAKSYVEIYQEIINALVGRPSGTQIQPEDHQQFALDILEYADQMGNVVTNGFIDEATPSTVPVQPDDANVTYVFEVAPDTTKTFANFRDSGGNPISVTTNASQAAIGFLIWNKAYWKAITAYLAVSNPSYEVVSGSIIQFMNGDDPVYPRTKAEAVFFDGDTSKTLDIERDNLQNQINKAGIDNSKILPFVNSGKYIDLSLVAVGEPYTISRNSATNYGNWEIDCNEGDKYALSVGGNTVAAKRYAILDANNYVLAFLQGDGSFVTDYIVTIPAGGKKLLVNSSSSGNPVVKKLNAVSEQLAEFEEKALIKEQQSLTDVEKRQVKDNLGFISQGDLNILITNFVSGYFIFSSNNLQVGDKLYLKPNPNSGYKYVIINCNEGDIFVATTTGYTANAKSYVILDINSCVLALGSANLNNSEITIPAGGKQIVFNTTQATPNVILYAGKLTKSLEGVESLNRETHTYKDLGYSESGYYYVANTVNVGDTLTITKQSATGLVCTLLNCQYGDKFAYKGKKNGANRTYVFLDSNNVVVGISSDANATYEGEVVAPLTSAKVIFNTTTDIEYYLKKYVNTIDEDKENINILFTSILATLPLYWRDQYLSVAGNVGDVATLTVLNFSNYGYLKIHVKAGYIFKISTSGNTSSAKAYAVLDEGLVIKEIQQNSVTNKVITIEEDGWLIVNSDKSSYSIEMINGNLLWGNQTFYSLFSKLYDVARFNNNYQFDQARIEQLEVNGIKLGFYQNVPLEGQYINTDIFEREAITDQSSLDFIQKRIVPYLYWNQNKVGTMVLFDEATGKPYIYDKNGNKVMFKIEE